MNQFTRCRATAYADCCDVRVIVSRGRILRARILRPLLMVFTCDPSKFAIIEKVEACVSRKEVITIQNPKLTLEKLGKVLSAWKTLTPTKSFGGMTLDQFETKVQPSLDAREAVTTAKTQRVDAQTKRTGSDAENLKNLQLVVHAIKGDPTEGEDSALYEACGYVRKSERKSGLSRKSTRTALPLAPAT
ncbi:MAG: hypothetical protein ACR2HH_05920 [Chthoniobacterales bacterium]